MAQVISRRLVLGLKIGALAALALTGTAVLAWRILIAPSPSIGAPVAQQVPFSHRHHVGDVGLDCRFCHATVETSAHPGMPATQVCMGCHAHLFAGAPMLAPVAASLARGKSLAWQRVHDLPEFAYFDHSIHTAKGVGCSTCHGAVDRMPLTWRTQSLEMQWCLACHRAPEKYIRPREKVFDMEWSGEGRSKAEEAAQLAANHVRTAGLTDCSTCHR